jgi:UPF0755 protein
MAVKLKPRDKKIKRSPVHRIILLALAIIIITALIIFYNLFNYILKPNIKTGTGDAVSIYIPTGASYATVKDLLYNQGIVISRKSFEWVAERKNYQNHVKPGHYIIRNSMNNNTLVNMLRSGAQVPVMVTFNNILNKEELAGKISGQIEPDSISLLRCWNDKEYLKSLNTSPGKVFMQFLPDTYEFWWTTDAKDFTERMVKESRKFWEGERTKKAGYAGLSIEEAIILASIIEKETQKNDEKPSIAGVYINRLKKGWPLQADPTVKYALGAFDLKRVLKVHTEYDSPYNTYLYKGLPPGPICMPSKTSIDAVLDYKKHDYMFFCAKADMSGYHAFSRTLSEHNRYASAYQNELNRRKIR